MNTPQLGTTLLLVARQAIGEEFGIHREIPAALLALPELQLPGASFVTLRLAGALRGCIGTLEAQRALLDDVRHNARAAAFLDTRFKPLNVEELQAVHIEVSLLSPPEPLYFASEAEALALLRPRIDGVILRRGGQRATFLPQVWEDLPDPRQFMAQLKRKAGLAIDDWSDDIQLSRYEVRQWKETSTT
ncbi:MAG: AmmeMemoRadiSam system protein A [Sterolibacterium sp.]|nr:AmmeMemoRadiSam system protein A [Sterolibacterium sp.]